jgi:polyphosphate kinase
MAKHSTDSLHGTDTPAANGLTAAPAEPPAIAESEPEAPLSAPRVVAALRHDPTAIRRLFESGEYPYKTPMRAKAYEAHMLELQRELLKAQL